MLLRALVVAALMSLWGSPTLAQTQPTPVETDTPDTSGTPSPSPEVPVDQKPHLSIDVMGAYLADMSQASLGFEKQGRMGFAIFRVEGQLSRAFKYKVEINPVNESRPLPSCGEEGYFFPNTPQNVGPQVQCVPDGRLRVDDYRYLALDPIPQQGPIRQAYIEFTHRMLSFRGGRFVLPIGFLYDEVGSYTSKDATHIQRINAQAGYGLSIGLDKRRRDGRPLASVMGATYAGDTRFQDYSYFYFLDGSLDANSGLNSVVSGAVHPTPSLEVKAAWKYAYSGSRVERLPNFWASKRNDMATVVSARYQPHKFVSVFGEYAKYTWGLKDSSAEILGLDAAPVDKPGYYVGVSGRYPITRHVTIGTTITHEEICRDDSLIKYLAADGLHSVTMGQTARSTAYRWFVTLYDRLTIAGFTNGYSNPFPWVSGIAPIEGDNAFRSRGDDKHGLVFRFTHTLR
jgi:hypothetical protein